MEHLHFAETDGVKVLEIPYENGRSAMDFVLPDAVDGLAAVEARLSPPSSTGGSARRPRPPSPSRSPRIEIAPAAPLSLGDTLSALGMPLAFDWTNADFTGIANPPRIDDWLFISQVFHKAFVKMDEKGTEAAAATAVMMASAGAAIAAAPPKEFKADHPFLFFLRDVRVGPRPLHGQGRGSGFEVALPAPVSVPPGSNATKPRTRALAAVNWMRPRSPLSLSPVTRWKTLCASPLSSKPAQGELGMRMTMVSSVSCEFASQLLKPRLVGSFTVQNWV